MGTTLTMKLGVNTFIWSAEFSRAQLALLPRIKEHGFDGVEVPMFDPADFPAADIRDGVAAETISNARSAPSFPRGEA